MRVFISGQKRGVHGVVKRELRRRAGIEPVIGHHLRLILRWLRLLLGLINDFILEPFADRSVIKHLTDDWLFPQDRPAVKKHLNRSGRICAVG